jgi:hypothetical protein
MPLTEEVVEQQFKECLAELYDDLLRSRLGLLRTGRRSSEFTHGIHTQSYLWGRAMAYVALCPQLDEQVYLTDIKMRAEEEAYARFIREVTKNA